MRSPESPADREALIKSYLGHLALERRQSPNTVKAVARDLGALEGDLLHISTSQLKTIMAKRHAAGAAPRTLARMASSWRCFYRYMREQGLLLNNPAEGLKTPRVPKSLPKALSVDDVGGLLRPIEVQGFQNLQARFLIELLYCTGLRISEALSLRLLSSSGAGNTSCVDLAQAEIRVIGKGSKARIVPMVPELVHRVHDHLVHRLAYLSNMPDSPGQLCLFVSRKGAPLSVRQAQLDVKRYAQLAGLNQNLHPHMLRHSFGSHVLQMSQNLRAVQELLGHASIASTQVYTALDFSHLTQVYDQAHPRAGILDDQNRPILGNNE
ncbi:MAG TPA: tyrosine recombinase XerC [Limnobacter sp.]|nr:tyrosine recombinase XerC [Limnobacter sp.]